jgi:hypothetical protein
MWKKEINDDEQRHERKKMDRYIRVSDEKKKEEKDEYILFSSSDKQRTSLQLIAPPSIPHPK